MQHDVFGNNNVRSRLSQPFLVSLQADGVDGPLCLACPVLAPATLKASKAVIPVVFEGESYLLALLLMKAVDRRSLRRPAGSIAAYRDDILRARLAIHRPLTRHPRR